MLNGNPPETSFESVYESHRVDDENSTAKEPCSTTHLRRKEGSGDSEVGGR
jgi:hypothetical protein